MNPGIVPGPLVAGDDLRQAFRDLPQPVAVVTGLSASGEPVGMTVSSLTSVSLAPPLVLFSPAVTSRAWAAARQRVSFAVNVLGQRHGELAMRFAGPGDRFAGVRTLPGDGGIPLLADALTVLLCDLREEYPAGDHTVVLSRVRSLHALHDGIALDTVSLRMRMLSLASAHAACRPSEIKDVAGSHNGSEPASSGGLVRSPARGGGSGPA